MRFWVCLAAWTLIPFGALGLLWSLVVFSPSGILINAAILTIGLHDLWQLRRVRREPRCWRWLALTQLLIGLIIGASMIGLGLTITHSELWQTACDQAAEILGHPYGLEEALARSSFIMEWGLVLGGIAVLLSQLWMAHKANRLAAGPRVPPPLP